MQNPLSEIQRGGFFCLAELSGSGAGSRLSPNGLQVSEVVFVHVLLISLAAFGGALVADLPEVGVQPVHAGFKQVFDVVFEFLVGAAQGMALHEAVSGGDPREQELPYILGEGALEQG